MFEEVESIVRRREELETRLSDPSFMADTNAWTAASKELGNITPIADTYIALQKAEADEEEAKGLLYGNDADMAALAKEELADARERIERLSAELKILLLPKDPNDERNVIVEIRAGAGGDEAAIFAGDLFRMYSRYAERKGYKIEIADESENELGGFKEIVFNMKGSGCYSRMKFESGVHRVQRIPETESGGRIHTSTATVAVLPEVDEVTVKINLDDCRVDTYRSSGAGGQHVNKTSSAIRITHIPTGIVVQCQNERSQFQNKDVAFSMLRAKLYEMELNKQQSAITSNRKSQVGTGDRSEKIRTYNYPQSRVSDHRVHFTTHRLDGVMDGDLDEIIDVLITTSQAEALSADDED